jgi:chromosome segregation ATPase
MLTANKLEKIIELEDNLKAQYQAKLDAKTAELERLQQERDHLQATVKTQLETITDLSGKASVNQKLEQQNRELHNRSENMKEEVATQKQRNKALQKELAEAREQVKALTQYDPIKMKKNLDDNKKRLAEKTTAADVLQKSLNKTKAENAELEQKVKELEAKVAELEPVVEETEATESEAAAA